MSRSLSRSIKVLQLIVGVLTMVALLSCSRGEWKPPADPQLMKLIEGNNEFSLEFYRKLAEPEKGNFVMSPCSVTNTLGMAYLGMRGKTAQELATVLKIRGNELSESLESLDIPAGDGVALLPANRVWIQQGFAVEPEFVQACRKSFDAEPAAVDFESNPQGAATTINDWVADKTGGMIPKLIEADINTLVLTNAVYFWGPWDSPFKEEKTLTDQPFTRADGSSTTVTLMVREAYLLYAEDENVQVLDLSYQGGSVSLTIILPKEPGGLQQVEKTLTVDQLKNWVASFRQQKIELYLAKFEIRSHVDATAALQSLGVTSAFSAKDADFSGIAKGENLYIRRIPMEAAIAVNEEGTKAVAATGGLIVKSEPLPDEARIFRTDHPFLFMIRHRKSGAILFIGRFIDPIFVAQAPASLPP